jgi:hypothetical protein
MKAHQYYSKQTQIEIFEEITKNQGTTNTVNRETPIQKWNYIFLLDQGCIEQEFSGGRDASMLVGENITNTGKVWRSTLYISVEQERKQYRVNWYIAGTFFVALASLFVSVASYFQ